MRSATDIVLLFFQCIFCRVILSKESGSLSGGHYSL